MGNRRSSWRWVDLVTACVVVLVLVTMVTTAIQHTTRASVSVRCQAHLRDLYLAVQHYALGYDGRLPGETWCEDLAPFIGADATKSDAVFRCPSGTAYVGNQGLFGTDKLLVEYSIAREIGLLADGREGRLVGGSDAFEWPHSGGLNVVFLDGRVTWVSRENTAPLGEYWDDPQ